MCGVCEAVAGTGAVWSQLFPWRMLRRRETSPAFPPLPLSVSQGVLV